MPLAPGRHHEHDRAERPPRTGGELGADVVTGSGDDDDLPRPVERRRPLPRATSRRTGRLLRERPDRGQADSAASR